MSIEVGAKVQGKVSGITNFGAFVDLADHQTGLVHISQISNNFVKDINDVLSVGDTVTVKVTKIGDDGKIALSIKDAEEHSDQHEHSHHEGRSNNFHHHGHHEFHPRHDNASFGGGRHAHQTHRHENFDEMLAGYMKESESRLSTLKRQTDGKRGGRGGRRS